jgi:glycosyltransferase involved in cell wall biosynthesis
MHGPVAVIFNRFGPYHLARLGAAAKRMPIVGIEVVAKDRTYAWDVVRGSKGFRRVTLFETEEANLAGSRLEGTIARVLERECPAALAVCGWSLPEALAGLAWAASNSVPSLVMSESQRHDHRRNLVAEKVKRRVVSLYSAALVGGSMHVEYVAELGLASERIFTGYDVVDNEHFRSGAGWARQDATLRPGLGLPPRFFLTCCRFVYQKNLLRLLEAYGRYCVSSSDPWSLVLLGDGPMRSDVEGSIRLLGLTKWVLTPGFIQYDTLPAYYGLAGAFILPSVIEPWGLVVNEAMAAGLPVVVSERCGCARDLVKEGRNGFTFDPLNVEGLADLMFRVSSMPEEQREAMGRASQQVISRWTPEFFAENLEKAVQAALGAPRPSASLLDRALLWALIHR